ncbi:MAG: hypothetical protein IT207_04295 [Fimbriimonadaceae bacterium]|nr:hypothetical protein [Fimbriimonadaceae bacterium]
MKGKIWILLVALLATVSAYGFAEDKRKLPSQPPKSERQVADDAAAFGGKYGAIGVVPEDTDGTPDDTVRSDGESAADLPVAEQAAAKRDMNSAAIRKVDEEREGGFPWWGAAFALVGIGVVLAARQYANKHVPVPNNMKRRF